MNRLGLLGPSGLDTEAREFYDTIYKYLSNKYPDGRPPRRNVREDGVMLGPFGIHLHTPAVGQHFHGIGSEIEKIPGLDIRNREIAILTTTAKSRAAYCMNAHIGLGKTAGLTQEEVDTILDGKLPPTFDEQGKIVWEATYDLINRSGPLSTERWERLLRQFGRDGTKHLIHLVAFYSYLAVVLNGFDAQVPE